MKRIRKNIRNLFLLLLFSSLGATAQTADSTRLDWKKIYTRNASLFFDQPLMGLETGVYTMRNGAVGNAGNMMIRGLNTLNCAAVPYVIIDGVPLRMMRHVNSFVDGFTPSPSGFINPLDVIDIGILKNDAGAALFGGKSSNGMINITTDKGEAMKASIEVLARVGLLQADYSMDMMAGEDFRAYLYDYMHNMGRPLPELELNPLFDPSIAKYNNQTDWLGHLQRNAMYQDYQLKMRGGDGDTRYMFGVGYTSQNETIESNYDRLSMRINLDYKITPKVSIANYLSYSYASMRFFGQGTDWDVHPIYVAATKSPFFSEYEYGGDGVRTYRLANKDELGKSNPYLFSSNLKNKGTENRVDGIIKVKWDINAANVVHTLFSVDYLNSMEEMRRLSEGIVADQYRNRQNAKRSYSDFMARWDSWYAHQGLICDGVKYDARAGFTLENNSEKSAYGRRVNAATDDFESLGYGDIDSVANLNYEHNLLNFYLTGRIRAWDWLAVDANVMLEGSSNFGKMGRWTFYGGVKAAADVWKTAEHNAALEAGWSRTGNSDVRGYYQHTLYYPTSYFGYGGVYLGNVANKDILPEITNTYEGGAKVRLFGNLADIYVGYYYKKTKDLLTFKALPIEIGLEHQFENNGEVVNQGFEFSANVRLFNRNDWKWSAYGNLSTLKNEITSLRNGDIIRSYDKFFGIAREGESVGSFYGYKVQGIFNSSAEVNLLRADGTPYLAGDYKMEDLNEDGIINDLDRQVIGSPLPKLYGGFGTELAYKRIAFSARFTYSYGNKVYNLFRQHLNSMSDFSNPLAEAKDRWLSEEVHGKGFLPRASWGDPSNNFAASDHWVEDGSYLKLQSLAISYDVPIGTRSHFFKGVNVFVNCNNLFTVSGYHGSDPEVNSSADPLLRGVDTGVSPNPRSYILGVKIAL